jgi:hypothetical protein
MNNPAPLVFPEDPGRLYFELVYWRLGFETPANISKVWVGEEGDEIELKGGTMLWGHNTEDEKKLREKYKPDGRWTQDFSIPIRIFWNNRKGSKHYQRVPPDILWTRNFPLLSQNFVDTLLKSGVAIQHKEITLCDVYGKPIEANHRSSYGPAYYLVLFPRQEELDLGPGWNSPDYKPFYHGQDDLFSDIHGRKHLVTFPVVEIIRKHRLRKVRVQGPLNYFHRATEEELATGKRNLIRRIRDLPDLRVPAKEWTKGWLPELQKFGYHP